MKKPKRLLLVASVLISVNPVFETAAAGENFIPMKDTSDSFTGEARFKDGSFAYTETHRITARDGRVSNIETEYHGPGLDKPLIARMKHEFLRPGFLPDYTYEDLRNKAEHRLTVEIDNRKIRMYRKVDGKEKAGDIKLEDGMATGQGTYFWVIANLEAVLRKEKVYTKFVVPALLEEYSFVAQLVDADENKATIKIKIDNWFFNLFAPGIQFDFDPKTKKLLEYRGTSNVADDKGKYRAVIITY